METDRCGFQWYEAPQPGEQADEDGRVVRTCTLPNEHYPHPIDHHDETVTYVTVAPPELTGSFDHSRSVRWCDGCNRRLTGQWWLLRHAPGRCWEGDAGALCEECAKKEAS